MPENKSKTHKHTTVFISLAKDDCFTGDSNEDIVKEVASDHNLL